MESGYELEPLTELPPLPQEFDSGSYLSAIITPADSLPPLPPSDFADEAALVGMPNLRSLEQSRPKKISDKIRSLEKLMPCEKKMDMGTVLEEAQKYIRFLQSQIAALRWMPLDSLFSTAGKVGEPDLLRSLTRQQILQVIATSPGARTALYTRGLCVFSYEQLLSLNIMPKPHH